MWPFQNNQNQNNQPNLIYPQQTNNQQSVGNVNAGLAPVYTGQLYTGQEQNSGYTGPQFQNQNQIAGLNSQPTGGQSFQNQYSINRNLTGFSGGQGSFSNNLPNFSSEHSFWNGSPHMQPAAGLQQQSTGYQQTSNTGSSQNVAASQRLRVPAIRLSFVSAQDQAQMEQVFLNAVKDSYSMSADIAKLILLQSQLSPQDLSKIWTLADSDRSGQLLFPQFVLALYLCDQKKRGIPVPETVPQNIMNEIDSMISVIVSNTSDSFNTSTLAANRNQPAIQDLRGIHSIGPYSSTNLQPTNTGNAIQSSFFNNTQYQMGSIGAPQVSQPNLGQLQAQTTGQLPMRKHQIGSANHGFSSQLSSQVNPNTPLGFQSQQQPLNMARTGAAVTHLQNPSGPMQSSYNAPVSALAAQPTGNGREWGFIRTPQSGLPGIIQLSDQLMPQSTTSFAAASLMGSADIPSAITKEEKAIYDKIFYAWDKDHSGYISGQSGIKIFSQSSLPRQDLELIWALADPSNRGKLNTDEFAIALHLIYRKLNGHAIPSRLPPELTPPSFKNFSDSVLNMRDKVQKGIEKRDPEVDFTIGRNDIRKPVTVRDRAKLYKYSEDDGPFSISTVRRQKEGISSDMDSARTSRIENLRSKINGKRSYLETLKESVQRKMQENEQQASKELNDDPTQMKMVLDEVEGLKKESKDLLENIRKTEEEIFKKQSNILLGNNRETEGRNPKKSGPQKSLAALTGQKAKLSEEDSKKLEELQKENERNMLLVQETQTGIFSLIEDMEKALHVSKDGQKKESKKQASMQADTEDLQIKEFRKPKDIKAEAQKRMNERLAALGINFNRNTDSSQGVQKVADTSTKNKLDEQQTKGSTGASVRDTQHEILKNRNNAYVSSSQTDNSLSTQESTERDSQKPEIGVVDAPIKKADSNQEIKEMMAFISQADEPNHYNNDLPQYETDISEKYRKKKDEGAPTGIPDSGTTRETDMPQKQWDGVDVNAATAVRSRSSESTREPIFASKNPLNRNLNLNEHEHVQSLEHSDKFVTEENQIKRVPSDLDSSSNQTTEGNLKEAADKLPNVPPKEINSDDDLSSKDWDESSEQDEEEEEKARGPNPANLAQLLFGGLQAISRKVHSNAEPEGESELEVAEHSSSKATATARSVPSPLAPPPPPPLDHPASPSGQVKNVASATHRSEEVGGLRSALMGSIRGGLTLRKAKTNDRSCPRI